MQRLTWFTPSTAIGKRVLSWRNRQKGDVDAREIIDIRLSLLSRISVDDSIDKDDDDEDDDVDEVIHTVEQRNSRR